MVVCFCRWLYQIYNIYKTETKIKRNAVLKRIEKTHDQWEQKPNNIIWKEKDFCFLLLISSSMICRMVFWLTQEQKQSFGLVWFITLSQS